MTSRSAADAAPSLSADAYTWRPLRILTIYRMAIVAGLCLAFLGSGGGLLPLVDAELFLHTSLAYLALSVLAFAAVSLRWPGFELQLYSQLSGDIVAISLLIFASGTLGSGLSALLLVAVAGGSLLTSARMAFFFAALASLLLLLQQIYAQLAGVAEADYTGAGLVGISIFATALAGNLLARRARDNQVLADRRGVDLANLEALNEHIVQRMADGVIVLDEQDRIRLSNQAAWLLLGSQAGRPLAPLAAVAPPLAAALTRWRQDGIAAPSQPLQGERGDYRPRFQHLDRERRQALVFLQDVAELRAQVQQEKLAGLGRLTAGIAHEVRNPLSAISHAAQLLEESPGLQPADRRLLEIIHRHGKRLNEIVENVLQLSRRRTAERQLVQLRPWLEEFVRDFRAAHAERRFQLSFDVRPPDLAANFDRSHLHQVLDNLCGNALRHGSASEARLIHLHARAWAGRNVELEVIDNSGGIDGDTVKRLFEPFFTTAASGTGLGLYLCRALCEANHAQLSYVPIRNGSCFRIRFEVTHREAA